MHVVLEIQAGPEAGKRLELVPGQAALIGRASWAELTVAGDAHMSGRHFRIECGDRQCKVVDQKSTGGTFLNGSRLTEAVVYDGDRITAGETTFTVTIEGGEAGPPRHHAKQTMADAPAPPTPTVAKPPSSATPAPAAPASKLKIFHLGDPLSEPEENRPYTPKMPAASEFTLKFSEQPGFAPAHPRGWLYAVIDGVGQRILAWKAKILGYDPILLVPGPQAPVLATKAPYFFAVPKGSTHFDDWNGMLGQQAGVLIDSMAEADALFDHVRGLLGSDDPEKFFRFYHPATLRTRLTSASPAEREKLFGPVQRWIVETETGDGWEALSRRGDQLIKTKLGKLELTKPT